MFPNEEKQWFSQVQASYPSIDSIFHLVNVSVLRSTNASQCQDVVFDCRDWTLKFATKQTRVAKIEWMMASQSEMESNRSGMAPDSSFGFLNSFALVWDLFKVVGQLWSQMRWCEMPFLVTSHATHRAGLVPEKGGLVINDKVSPIVSLKRVQGCMNRFKMYQMQLILSCLNVEKIWQLNMNWHMKESWESKGVPPMSTPLDKRPH